MLASFVLLTSRSLLFPISSFVPIIAQGDLKVLFCGDPRGGQPLGGVWGVPAHFSFMLAAGGEEKGNLWVHPKPRQGGFTPCTPDL
jgi:hypothetical protein